MFDFAEILDATKPVTVPFLGKEVVCEVYTFGWERVGVEESGRIDELSEVRRANMDAFNAIETELAIATETTPDKVPALRDKANQLRRQVGQDTALVSRLMVPVMVKSWMVDGEPFIYRGQEISPLDVVMLPDALVMAVAAAASDVFGSDSEKKASADISLIPAPEAQPLTISASN